MSVGGVRYGVRLAAAKYSSGPRRALAECCGQSPACCGPHSVSAKPELPACFRAPPPTAPSALDRLQRFRFGGRSGGERKARPDKAERLRELTERLKGRAPPPLPPPRLHRGARVSAPEAVLEPPPPQHRATLAPRAFSECDSPKEDDRFDAIDLKPCKVESRAIVGSYAQRTIPFRSASFSQVDFNAIDGKYQRSSPKLVTVSRNAYKLGELPTAEASPCAGSSVCAADLTLPRKRDVSSRPSPSTADVSLDVGSTPSLDSAVGSDEGLAMDVSLSRIPTVVPDLSHKHSGTRSLTHPLPGRSSSVDSDLSFAGIDCGGRKSLQYIPKNHTLREVCEESDTSLADSARAHSDTISPTEGPSERFCPFDFPVPEGKQNPTDLLLSLPYKQQTDDAVSIQSTENIQLIDSLSPGNAIYENSNDQRQTPVIEVTPECTRAQIFIETPEGKVLKTATASVIPVPVYECIVKEWSNIPSERWVGEDCDDETKLSDAKMIDRQNANGDDKEFSNQQNILETPDDETITSEQVENLLATVQNASKLPPPVSEEKRRVLDKSKRRKGIYITKWPIQDELSGLILPESVISAQFGEHLIKDVPNGEIVNLETGDSELFIGDNGRNRSRTLSDNTRPVEARQPGDSARWTGQDTACIWTSPQDEPMSPEADDQAAPLWPKSLTEPRWNSRPALTYQSSEEKEEFSIPKLNNKRCTLLARADSLSEGESESGGLSTPNRDRTSPSPFNPSDVSDNETRGQHTKERGVHAPRRYSKRPLRGPYGQMLEAEMKKPEGKLSKHDEELKFLDELVASPSGRPISPNVGSSRTSLASNTSSLGIPEPRIVVSRSRGAGNHSLDDTQLKNSFGLSSSPSQKTVIRSSPKRKVSANIPYSAPNPVTSPSESVSRGIVFHQRTTSSPSKLEGFSPRNSNADDKKKLEPSPELLAELLRGSSERLLTDTSLDGIPFCVQRHNVSVSTIF